MGNGLDHIRSFHCIPLPVLKGFIRIYSTLEYGNFNAIYNQKVALPKDFSNIYFTFKLLSYKKMKFVKYFVFKSITNYF